MNDQQRLAQLERTLKWVLTVASSGQDPAMALSRIQDETWKVLQRHGA